jgi:shikimate dehydrogenase
VKAAVAGRPIGHSLSPVLHLAAYRALGLDWTYTRCDCGVAELADLFARLRAEPGQWAGLSLTMPLKEAAVPLLDSVETPLGVVNTVVVEPGGALAGFNTDVDGILAGLGELVGERTPEEVAVLGAGGTARAALAALALFGVPRAVLLVRDTARARPCVELGARLGVATRTLPFGDPPAGIPVLATVPAGADDALHVRGPLLDVRYAPWPTPLAQRALAEGFAVVGGHRVLLGQAVRQVELMTGREAPLDAMRTALQAAAGGSATGTPEDPPRPA